MDTLLDRFRHGVLVGLSDTLGRSTRPGQDKARTLLEVLRGRPGNVLRFADDLTVPPTSNQAERDLRPSKVLQNTSGRLTSEERTRDRYTIRSYVSTVIKHGHDAITVMRDALTGHPWTPVLPASTRPPPRHNTHHREPNRPTGLPSELAECSSACAGSMVVADFSSMSQLPSTSAATGTTSSAAIGV